MYAPLLALESTVIAHGLPYPENLESARELEALARAQGAEPRTVAILNGQVKIGLTEEELEHLARAAGVMKVSRRDIGLAIAGRRDGATTVSATMFLAHRAGISVFTTGGIGGVHRAGAHGTAGSERPVQRRDEPYLATDISADLVELATTPVILVCAGAKAILDLAATLEFLETWRVPVLGFQTDELPAFYSRKSGLAVQARVESVAEVVAIARAHWACGNTSAVLVGVPIPAEDEIPRETIEPSIQRALAEAEGQGLSGSAVTPFVLRRLAEITAGASVKANRALLRNNVIIGARISKEWAARELPMA